MFQPIHYSLVINAMILAAAGALAWVLREPLLLVIGLMVLQHAVGRFAPENQQPDGQGGPGMGFLADIGRDDDE